MIKTFCQDYVETLVVLILILCLVTLEMRGFYLVTGAINVVERTLGSRLTEVFGDSSIYYENVVSIDTKKLY
jgi:hypothetical protein